MLKKCAAHLDGGGNFEVLDVELLTLEENPRSKCWKVTVPFRLKGLMEMDELYPPGWKHRKFYGSRKGKENLAKRGRKEGPTLVENMIQEREVEAEVLRQRQHDEHQQELDNHVQPNGHQSVVTGLPPGSPSRS